MTNLNNIVNDIGQYLKHQIEEGQTTIEINQEIMKKLGKTQIQKTSPDTSIPAPEAIRKSPQPAVKPVPTTIPISKSTPAPTPVQTSIPAQKTTVKPIVSNRPTGTNMNEITAQISNCKNCSLCKIRTNTVPGQGNNTPEIMFIGEAPGAKEDEQGIPFVGRSGNFLTKMIVAMGYSREDIFIGNILKCRPPDNRKPTPEEIEICIPYLKQQIAILKPKVIIALGSTSVKGLLGKTPAITKLRGEWQKFEGIPLMPTFHPAYILRNQSKKSELWADLKKVLAFLGKKPPTTKKQLPANK